MVEGETLVFKVFFFFDRLQQRSLLLRNAVLSGLWSRSLILAWLVEAFQIFAQYSSSASFSSPAGVHEVLDEPGERLFRTFLQNKKVRREVRTQGRN